MKPNSTPSGGHVAVVGGGIIGTMCAWYLTESGYRVTIIDRDQAGAACSHGNCGYITPSHVLPLCQPGAIAKTLKSLLRRNSPFAIKPRFSQAWFKWFWNFAQQCNHEQMLSTAHSIHALLQSSLDLYRELVAGGLECEWQERGCLVVYDDEQAFESYAATDRLLRDTFGVGATAHDGASLQAIEPAIKPGCAGAWHYEDDCHVRPDVLIRSLRERLEERAVTFLEGTDIDGFDQRGGLACAALSGKQRIEADHFVIAAGALTPLLEKDLGVRIPIEPGKGYSITMPKPTYMPRHPIIFEDTHVAITPMHSGYRIGSTMEFVGYNTSIHPKRLRLLTDSASKYLHDPLGSEVQETWYGWRPMTWDGKPIIDRSPALSNAWIAAGHNMLGLSTATGTGRLLAELLSKNEPHIDPSPYSAARFQ